MSVVVFFSRSRISDSGWNQAADRKWAIQTAAVNSIAVWGHIFRTFVH